MKIRISRKQIPLFVLIGFGILLFAMGILNHYFFRTFTYDYAYYNFAFWDFAHFRLSPLNITPGNYLQEHFSFVLMYFVPIYWILNWITGTYTLILIQYTMILIGGWYSYKIIKLKTDNLWLGAGILVYYFTLLGRYTTFANDVNVAVISACFIPIFIYYFEKRKYLISLVILILSLFSRENVSIWFVFIFIVLIIEHRKDKKAVLYSLIGIAISIIYFILLFKIFIPSVETPEKSYTLFEYSALGATPGEAFTYIIKNPVESIKLFFINHLGDPANDGIKSEFYWVYLISGGFVLFLRPQYLIWFIPIVAQKVLNDNPFRWGIATYYSIEIVTLLPLSVFLVLSSIKSKSIQMGLTITVCMATIFMTIYKLEPKNNRVPGYLYLSKQKFYDKSFYKAPFNIKGVNNLLKQIPPTAKVSGSNVILPHISQRQYIYFFPNVVDAEYIVFSVFDDNYLYAHDINEQHRNKYLSDPKWEIVANEFPIFLLKFNESSTTNESNMQKVLSHSDTLFCDYEKIDTVKGITVFSNSQKADTVINLTSEISRSGSHSLKLSKENPFNTNLKIKDIDRIRYLQISAWCYGDENQAHIIASSGKDFYMSSSMDTQEPSGWKKLVLNFWVPLEIDNKGFSVYLWNSGSEPIYFDDLQIIKNYIE